MRLAFDIETDGLLHQMTTTHSLVMKNVDSGEVRSVAGRTPKAGEVLPSHLWYDMEFHLRELMEADEIIGHNIIKYDIPAIQKIYPWFEPQGKVTDTLVDARLIWSNIRDSDLGRVKAGRLPGKLIGSHSLEAWGCRLGNWKGDYSKEKEAELRQLHLDNGWDKPTDEELRAHVWGTWTPEMQRYCEQDVEVTAQLYARIESRKYAPKSRKLEHGAATLCAKIERNGFPFDKQGGADLYATLAAKRQSLEVGLVEAFGSWWEASGIMTPKRTVNFKDPLRASMIEGAPYTKIKRVTFNPSSRQHVAKRLKAMYDWKPKDFTPNGDPKVDEDILSKLPYHHAKLLVEYYLLDKRIGQLAEGKQAWLRVANDTNEATFINGSINSNGAVTGRATHSFPNVGQVPSLKAQYGRECRELFGIHGAYRDLGWVQAGTDMSGLELRCLSHFMARWDGGAYGETVLNGDIHTANQEAAGLPTRDDAKTFIYAFLYGAGDGKLGSITKSGRAGGKRLRQNFEAKIPAMGKLTAAVKATAKAKGYLVGLDGRHLHVRSEHSALNTLLQSAGALLCKKWMTLLEEHLIARGLFHGWNGDFAFMAWVHDEVQIACRTQEIAELVTELSPQCAREAGEYFNFRCPLDADSKIGMNWADCH